MDSGANKTSVEVIKEGAFRGTCFRDIYSGINGKWYKKTWKEFDQLKDINQSIITQVIMMLVSINMVSNVEHRLDFGEINVGLIK